jgi:actin cytoskeleton-regulatory complex protein SLA1
VAPPLNLGLRNRQRPTPPQVMSGQGALVPPPPARPLSAPQSVQPSVFAPPSMPALQPHVTGIAPPGHSLNELNQQRFQQPYMGNFQQPTGQGFMQLNPAVNMPQHTGFVSQQFMPPQMTGAPQMQSPFPDPRAQQFSPIPTQPTGYPSNFQPPQQFPQQTGINTYLPPALEPQRTGIPPQPQPQPQQTGFGNFGAGFNPGVNGPPQPPPIAPLQPQKTGPAPPVRFGMTNKIAPQPTGRRANLAQASK